MEQAGPRATVLVTGASGFIGHHLVQFLLKDHDVIAFARRPQKEIGLQPHPNLQWVLVDLTDADQLDHAFRSVSASHNIQFIFHLAAYYDFGDQVYSEVYEKTNVVATGQLLELARGINPKRFIFSSSLVVSKFPQEGDLVSENSPADATYPYAITKRKAEELVRSYSKNFPCSIVRLGAVYSDWCENEPLYHFLKVWLSDRWDSSILPGRGSMAIPYIHICCVVDLFIRILNNTESLGPLNVFLASSDEPISLKKLFQLSTRHFSGQEKAPVFLPGWLVRIGIVYRDFWGRLRGKRPFERLWMTDYLDQTLPTDCSYTRNVLGWHPRPRHQLPRRLLHLIENMKAQPEKWHQMNIHRLLRNQATRPSLILGEEMVQMHETLVDRIFAGIMDPSKQAVLPFYQNLAPEELRWYISVVYNHLLTSVRHGDRSIMITFAQDVSHRQLQESVSLDELCKALTIIRDVTTEGLYHNPKLSSLKLLVHDYITLAIQLAIDEIKDIYENVPR